MAELNDSRLPDRFWAKVTATPGPLDTECWIWTGAKSAARSGGQPRAGGPYGSFGWAGHVQLAHRVSYSVLVEPIPDRRVLDHLCRVHLCVNPAHTDPVTQRVNTQRGDAAATQRRLAAERTCCRRGHEYTEANTYIAPSGYRNCRSCQRLSTPRKAVTA